MRGDARWYEAAFVVGITNALNVVADGLAPAGSVPLLTPVAEPGTDDDVRGLFAEVRSFYGDAVPLPLRLVAHDAGYARDLWVAVRRAFADNTLVRPFKEGLAFAVSLTTRSPFGTAFHL